MKLTRTIATAAAALTLLASSVLPASALSPTYVTHSTRSERASLSACIDMSGPRTCRTGKIGIARGRTSVKKVEGIYIPAGCRRSGYNALPGWHEIGPTWGGAPIVTIVC